MTRSGVAEFRSPVDLFPPEGRLGASLFWIKYGLLHSMLLPVVLFQQIVSLLFRIYVALFIRGRLVEAFQGDLKFKYLSFWQSFLTDILFDERFILTVYKGAIIDPGPRTARHEVEAFCSQLRSNEDLNLRVLCSHFHEEHVGNAAFIGKLLGIPVYGTERTLFEIRSPSSLPWYRDFLMGEVQAANQDADLRVLPPRIHVGDSELVVLDSPGHCIGHASFYDPERRILFAGDSFMGEIFTAPNEDFVPADLMQTLVQYQHLDVDVLVEAHGKVYTMNPEVPHVPHLVVRREPREAIIAKMRFLTWAKEAVSYGRRQGFSYGVIERCLFSWRQRWPRDNWLIDQLAKELSGGDFSRSQFVRRLAAGLQLSSNEKCNVKSEMVSAKCTGEDTGDWGCGDLEFR